MTSEKVIVANRRNAGGSTGPRTAAGKRKAAANSRRHGLRGSLDAHPAMGGALARIAAALAGPNASPALRALVEPIADAQVDLLRIRSARAKLIDIAVATTAGAAGEANAIVESLPRLLLLDRYERSAMRRRHRAMRELRKSFTMWRK